MGLQRYLVKNPRTGKYLIEGNLNGRDYNGYGEPYRFTEAEATTLRCFDYLIEDAPEDTPEWEHSRYLRALTQFREEYKKTTGEQVATPVEGKRTSQLPTWEYVCWLEAELFQVKNIFPEVVKTLSATSYIKGDIARNHDLHQAGPGLPAVGVPDR